MIRESRAITLIALIITIIVLLILVGVTVNVAFSEDGLIAKSRLAKEQTEMASLKEEAENIKIFMQYNATQNNKNLTQNELVDEINKQLGKSKKANIIISKDGKYDIIVGNDLEIIVRKHEEIIEGEKQVVSDLVIPKILEQELSTVIYLYVDIEKYYPELMEQSIVNLVNYVAQQESGQIVTNMEEAKQYLINMPDSPFNGMQPNDITINDIIMQTGLGNNQNDYFNRGGFLFLIETDSQKRSFCIASMRLTLSIFSADNKDFINYTDNQILQHMIDTNSNYTGRTPESLTNDEIAKMIDSSINSMDEYWNKGITQLFDSSLDIGDIVNFYPSLYLPIVLNEFTIQAEGNYKLSYITVYETEENQTCTFHVETDKYICDYIIDVTGIGASYYTSTEPYTDTQGNTAYIPEGFRVDETQNTINNGLVVRDKNGNRFIWVPVSDSDYNEMIDDSSKKGKLYNFDSNGNATYKGLETPATSEQTGFNNMIASIKKYKGFYVGQYQTTIKDGKAIIKHVTIADKQSDTFSVMLNAQKNLNTNSSSVSSSMIWGCQWDRIMKWVNGSNDGFGNLFNVGATLEGRHDLMATINNIDKVKNIYQLEGDKKEWTMEPSNIVRGGSYKGLFGGGINAIIPASARTTASSNDSNGSRIILYIK